MKRLLLMATLASACVVGPAVAQAAPRSGVVVDYRARSHTAAVAAPGGRVLAVHTGKAYRVGARVNIRNLRRLHNGTFAASLVRTGHASRARLRGVIVAKLGRRAIAIGAKGTTFVVKMRRTRVHRAFSGPLTVGTTVVADVSIDGTELEADDVTAVQTATAGQMLELEGRVAPGGVTAPDPTTGMRTFTVTISDDGVTADFVVQVPDPTVDLTAITPGAEVELNVTANGDGTFTLASGARNGDEQEADDGGEDGSGSSSGSGSGLHD